MGFKFANNLFHQLQMTNSVLIKRYCLHFVSLIIYDFCEILQNSYTSLLCIIIQKVILFLILPLTIIVIIIIIIIVVIIITIIFIIIIIIINICPAI